MTVTAFQQANQLLREGKLEAAIVAYRQAIDENPQFYGAYQNLGETWGKLGRWEEAVEAYQRAVELKPDAAWSYWGLSQALQQVGRVEEAQQRYQQALEIDPKLSQLPFMGSSVKAVNGSSVQLNTPSDLLQRSQEKIRQFHNKHWGERCVIIGNGPSLNEMDLSFLKHEICFGTNKIYLGFERWEFSPTYYVAVNPFVIEQSVDEIRKISCPKFIGNRGISYFDPTDDIIFIKTFPSPGESFSKRADVGLNEGCTVTYVAMQLAYYMGFSEVVLIGVDHHFVTQGTPHQAVVSDGDDPNHFDPRYFGQGLTWQLPDLENSEKSYQVAKQVFEESGRKIIDATVNGQCQVFPKEDYRLIFSKSNSINANHLYLDTTYQPKEAKNKSSRITIILSCFKADQLITSYIDSLLNKQITDYCTLLAVNFPSSHKNPQFVEQQLKRYPDLKLVNLGKNVSLYEAWNLGCRIAETKYVANLNLDDRVSPDYYSYGLGVLEENNGDLFSSFAVLTSTIGEVSESSYYEKPILEYYFGDSDIIFYSLIDLVKIENQRLLKKSIPHCAPIWKRELHKELGYFDCRKFDFAADTEFWLRIAAANKKMIVSKTHRILFYCATGTASDRLMHPQNEVILSTWSKTFPPLGYKETHLGRKHDLLQHCMNMNVIFSSEKYFNHLKGDSVFLKIFGESESILKDKSGDNNLLQMSQVEVKTLDKSFDDNLKQFRNLHNGQDALLICNGPSLNQVDFPRVDKDRFVIFGLNKIFLGIERLGIYPDYIAAVNPKVISQSARELSMLPIPKFMSNRSFCRILNEENNTFYIKTTPLPSQYERFSKDISQYVHEGWTVTHVALQILYFMGIKRVYIVGMDHRFKQHIAGKENFESKIIGEDIDHFDPAYFGNGQSWDLPDLANSEISYRAALDVFQKEGREIYDCTINGACEIFPKLNIDTLYTKPILNVPKVPRVSVIMPTFNTERYIDIAIKSVIEQSFKDWELIIIDDGSTDNTINIARQFAERDARIKFFQNVFGKGVSGARNTGLRYARGEYITFLDSDDFFYQDSLASRVNILDNDKKINACFCSIEFVNHSGDSLGLVLSKRENVYYKDFWQCPLQMTTPLIRSNSIGDIRFDETLTNGEDFLFLSQLAQKINVFKGTQKSGVAYRVHPQSTVIKNYYLHEENLEKSFSRVYENYHKFNNKNSQYKENWPDLKTILGERKVSRLLWAVISHDKKFFIALLQDKDLAKLVHSQAIKKLVNNKLGFLTLRYFGCSINNFQEVLRKWRVDQFTRDPEIYRLASNLCNEIQNILASDKKN